METCYFVALLVFAAACQISAKPFGQEGRIREKNTNYSHQNGQYSHGINHGHRNQKQNEDLVYDQGGDQDYEEEPQPNHQHGDQGEQYGHGINHGHRNQKQNEDLVFDQESKPNHQDCHVMPSNQRPDVDLDFETTTSALSLSLWSTTQSKYENQQKQQQQQNNQPEVGTDGVEEINNQVEEYTNGVQEISNQFEVDSM
jgi:hypothetical protein